MEKEELLNATWALNRKRIGDMDRDELIDVLLWHANAYTNLLDRRQREVRR